MNAQTGPDPDRTDAGASPVQTVLVTGPSGAGRSTAVHALEDLGFEAIDNLPLSFVRSVLDGTHTGARLVLGIDARNRDFSVAGFEDLVAWLRAQDRPCDLLYLDCRSEVLLARYSETRRRHPLAPAEGPDIGIRREIDLLAPIRDLADLVVDTSDQTPHDLRAELARWYAADSMGRMSVTLHSFGYKRGMPRGIDMVFDCRFLANPYWEPRLRPRDGRDPDVAAHVAADPRFGAFFDKVTDIARLLLPAFREEGKSHLSVGFGCTGGQHRSVATVERIAATLAAEGWDANVRHHELERRDRVDARTAPLGQSAQGGGQG